MSKRKRNLGQEYTRPPASSSLSIHPNATLGPETPDEPPTSAAYFRDATSSANYGEEEREANYAESYAALLDKHLFSGKRQLPVSQIAFILLALAIGWIFIQDNSSGVFKQNDWSAIWWTIKKCLALALVFFVLFLSQFIFNKILSWIRNR
jgi:hypothetical protein